MNEKQLLEEIMELEIKIEALNIIYEDQNNELDITEYELEQANSTLKELKNNYDATRQSYLDIIKREKEAKTNPYDYIN
ncbi:hypothetical protein SAMN04488558_1125 [Ignavigranum ruoffiae]|uniref:Uncharacterized protein n=1 Tax=Ignavigranum ruoffiae TaxID=89093 RepID=A0A1H9G8I7_9LACT|nr:hypothetical protein [Ignavigranum ruoffiae]SEQ46343.1 hypothetical protein SAMN04488558_1125 [Ignavigranum ruoffiae]